MLERFYSLYNTMANSHEVAYMRTFGNVHKEMMEWMVANKPDLAEEMIDKLESVKWKNYLTSREAEKIVSAMEPKAPWSRDQWKAAMTQHGYAMEKEPCFNSCSLYVVMNMIMSDSSDTIEKFVSSDNLFEFVYEMAVDKLTDKDSVFNVRLYFSV